MAIVSVFLRCFEGPKRSLKFPNGLSKYSDLRSHQWRTVTQIPPSGLLKFPCGHQSETLKKTLAIVTKFCCCIFDINGKQLTAVEISLTSK